MFKTICVGFDGSDPSENAVRAACDLAGKYGASVHIVHTPHPQTVAFAMGSVTGYHVATAMPDPAEVRKTAVMMLEKASGIAADGGQADVVTHIGSGDAAEALTAYAASVGAGLIVTGRRGLGNLSALMLGSTSQSVAHKASCAHLTVT